MGDRAQYMKSTVTLDEAERAYDEWGANCGPGALAAVLNKTLEDVRPHLIGFDEKRYTNPTMMLGALRSMGSHWTSTKEGWPRGMPWDSETPAHRSAFSSVDQKRLALRYGYSLKAG